MFGIGPLELVVIMIVALLVFGPERLPEMIKQAAAFVRDLRAMVANARRDINLSAEDFGIDEDDLKTLRALRNPKSFVRDQVLDGVSLDDLGLSDKELGLTEKELGLSNGGGRTSSASAKRSGPGGARAGAGGTQAGPGGTRAGAASDGQATAEAASQPAAEAFDPDAT